MTIHALTEYIRYGWKAKSRHGVHSPFVYDFIERVLKNNSKPADAQPVQVISYENNNTPFNRQLSSRYQKLLNRVIHIYNFKTLHCLSVDTDEEPIPCDVLLMTAEPKIWIRLFNRHLPSLKITSCIIVANIHKTRRHTGKWNRLCRHPKVKLSIDLYGVGLMFFNEDFKEKQSFVLRY